MSRSSVMNMNKFAAIVVLMACLVISMNSSHGIIVIIAGVFIAALLILHSSIEKLVERKGSGELSLSPTGMTISWEVMSDQPIRTVFPENPTDTTNDSVAKSYCEQGRAIVKAKNADNQVNLEEALGIFRKAIELDDKYWEPRINIAQILLLTGRLMEAYSEADTIRIVFSNIPLAYAKAGLIKAKVIEQGLSAKSNVSEKQSKYVMIVEILRENLERCPGHLTSMISLGRAMLLSGSDTDEMKEYLSESMQYKEFAAAFLRALRRDGLLDSFNNQFPGFVEKVGS